MARYGIGSSVSRVGGGGSGQTTPPTNPGNGSGGAGTLGAVRVPQGGLSFSAAQHEISDITTGRVTLALVDLALIALVGFYIWTRSSQGG